MSDKEKELRQYLNAKRGVCRNIFGSECKSIQERKIRLNQFIIDMKNTYDLYPNQHKNDANYEKFTD